MNARSLLDSIEPIFIKGGKLEKYYGLYEMVDTFIYTPADVTRGTTHVRDGNDLKRTMTFVVIATFFCILMAMYNSGYQANLALEAMGLDQAQDWRSIPMALFGYSPMNPISNFVYGALFFLPIYLVTLAVGGVWEVLFATVRGHEVNEGFLVSSMLYALILPPDMPIWQVALGISFGIVIGKEVFGGTGKNFLNPALTGRAFLFFAYPAAISGDTAWVGVDGYTMATPLGIAAQGGIDAVNAAGYGWFQSFMGFIPGSIGETSTLAIMIGAAFLLYTRIASYRIMGGVLGGMVATSLLFNIIGSDTNPMFSIPFYWHLTLGSFAFGMVYMATDPVSAAMTNKGRWIYGALIGVMVVLVRVVNPAFPEGMMLSILFANMFAPVIDYFVVQANIKRRMKRHA
ncbi:MAG: NADH:ubiquinone reductase (Na(+)-transporting) subunit B [Gammaproteobacteria bacterium]|jgi:Na+-transporting NADH:ubiquinone oxidoreductase subunit B|nr:NADH:ubiquinone reductase (Na(+)-transporting) subunit B [Gammaproteobacteria bacterium]MBT5222592.1 NADH:ubiquinone reductase (Na(+)-transporting) subunit B [Gammaproteobacteria bacterium]MBT5826050.1 NADH:ubiquinone reductase (Na(+)-transporting) subunit B [Gammaproteobacteria bacterium]MBT5966873.1 NADH:ubiquinone reductase (Na(+)-transporting) subunit B [Gammaproteobacteria bacterium]MBT6419279.1 NADH:ubiquinone reductase (Na(+)-transporting) subunit B [Gammaproteobacteria bacterium]